MKYLISLILLAMLITSVNAGIIYMKVIDMTGDGYETIHVYQKDSLSTRYVKTINSSMEEPFTMGTSHNYTWVIEPRIQGVLKNPENPKILNYIYQNQFFYAFLITAAAIITYVLFRDTKRGK